MDAPRRMTAGATLAVIGLLAAADAASSRGSGDALFGRAYFATGIVKNGERHQLVEGTTIRVKFLHGEEADWVEWRAGCNHFDARVTVTGRRLNVGPIYQTDILCDDARMRQEDWVAGVFDSDPRWVRDGRRLRLKSDDDVIRLRRPA